MTEKLVIASVIFWSMVSAWWLYKSSKFKTTSIVTRTVETTPVIPTALFTRSQDVLVPCDGPICSYVKFESEGDKASICRPRSDMLYIGGMYYCWECRKTLPDVESQKVYGEKKEPKADPK